MKTYRTLTLLSLSALVNLMLATLPLSSPAADRLEMTSPAYRGGSIPQRFTCDGKGTSPPLSWHGVPEQAKSLALTVVDPDASGYVHWVLYDLPSTTKSLPEGASTDNLPKGVRHGLNSHLTPRFRRFCPPHGLHHYVHTLYVLDIDLPDLKQPTRKALQAAMKGHVIAKTKFTATYTRGGS